MSHSHHAPTLPEVTDEAANTPNWVPALGFGLFVLLAFLLAVRFAVRDASSPQPPADAAAAAAPAAANPSANPPQAIGAPAH